MLDNRYVGGSVSGLTGFFTGLMKGEQLFGQRSLGFDVP